MSERLGVVKANCGRIGQRQPQSDAGVRHQADTATDVVVLNRIRFLKNANKWKFTIAKIRIERKTVDLRPKRTWISPLIAFNRCTFLPQDTYSDKLIGRIQETGSGGPRTIVSGSFDWLPRRYRSKVPLVRATKTLSQCCLIWTTLPSEGRLMVATSDMSSTLYISSLKQIWNN